jgi:hypothetical protein
VALVAVGAAGGGAAFAVASVPDGSGVIHACVNAVSAAGGVLPSTAGANVTVIDPSAGQHCSTADPAGGPPAQIPLSWSVTGPQGPPGPPGAAGTRGVAGPAGTGNNYTVALAPAGVVNRKSALGQVTMDPGRAGFSFPLLSEGLVVGSALSSGAGSSGGGARKVSLHDILITKLVDKSSPKLFHALVSGKHFSTVKIELAKAGKVYERITLSSVLVASLQQSRQAGGVQVSESLTFNFSKIEIAYKS